MLRYRLHGTGDAMTDRELMQMALDALETGYYEGTQDSIKALRDRLAQPEPVHASDISQERVDETAKREHKWVEMQCPCGHKMYVKHTGREWVGLTEEEFSDLLYFGGRLDHVEVPLMANFIRAIQAKLKEKNT